MYQVRDSLEAFRVRERQIKGNPDLTQVGRERALAALTNEKTNYKATARGSIKPVCDLLMADQAKLRLRMAEAQDKASAGWDFGRLNHESLAASSRLKVMTDFGEAKALFDRAISSGDKHQVRAWLTVAPGALHDNFAGNADLDVRLQLDNLVKSAPKQLEALLDTPELAKLRAEGTEIANDLIEAKKITEQAGEFYNPSNVGPLSLPDEFNTLLPGLTITQEWIPGTMNMHSRVEVSDVTSPEGMAETSQERPLETDQQRRDFLGL
jgi:hypothetical protein